MFDVLEMKPERPDWGVGHVQRRDSEYISGRTLRVRV